MHHFRCHLHFPRLPDTVKVSTLHVSQPALKYRFIFIKTSRQNKSGYTSNIHTQRFKKIQRLLLFLENNDRQYWHLSVCTAVCLSALQQEAPQSSFLWFVALSGAAFKSRGRDGNYELQAQSEDQLSAAWYDQFTWRRQLTEVYLRRESAQFGQTSRTADMFELIYFHPDCVSRAAAV